MVDPLVEALKSIAEGSMQGDRSLLNLVNTLIDRFKELEQRVVLLEEIQKLEAISRANIVGGV